MESYARPLRELADALSWFVRARELRVLHVRTTADLRATSLRLVAAQELHPENRSPWVVLEDPSTATSEGWLERLERLRTQHAVRRERMAQEGEALPDLPPRPAAAEPFAAFGAQLVQLLQAKASWHEGIVVVFAPSRIEHPRPLLDALCALLDAPALAAVRWAVVEPEPSLLDPLAAHVGEQRSMCVVCHVDEDEAQAELAQRIDAAEQIPAGISGPARVGAAWPPGISPPTRRDRPLVHPAEIDALLEKEGVDLPLAGTAGVELGHAVLRGAQALRRGDPVEAVQHQARARDICVNARLPRETILMNLVLGAYLLAAGDAGRATRTYAAASELAENEAVLDLAAQAQLALGAIHLRAGERADAAVAYARAAALARNAGITILAIEALRLAGQAQLDLGNRDEASRLWTAALDAAEHAPPEEAKVTSAAEVARSLAALLRDRGRHAEAHALEARSWDFEA
ncbi:hypothetical protein [Chondromyces apiculatus]|uniref:Uncharacterized protein n=1 Tax=Chondromyces apiculatus DSM 436 TaxID=1192034 RepID=A0A017TGS5_9BACT|nr:hypothetical protein [Chondromyces apiculatus]EYF08102.1 Hypothetical protein CAP_5862 [Chondromyces apiculatus DSM 436]